MKYFIISFLIFLLNSCSDKKLNDKNSELKIFSTKISAENFEKELIEKRIVPTFKTSLDSLSLFSKNLKISIDSKNNNFKIAINDNDINVNKLVTLNNMWGGKDSLNYANEITQIKYYEKNKILLIQLDFYPCTGLGCSVNYQVLYNLKSKKTFGFGRFRTGYDMGLYNYHNETYYLSKNFDGRNAQLKDTIKYELFKIAPNKIPLRMNKIYAKFTYENENYDSITSFSKNWIK